MSNNNNNNIFKTSMSRPSETDTFLSQALVYTGMNSLLFAGHAK